MINIDKFISEKSGRKFDAEITFNQLMQKPIVVASWGARHFGSIREEALVFKVNGFIHQGTVVITLNFWDLYDIHLFDKNKNKVGESVTGIYCDQLVDVIDSLVETKPN
jgi:hypothetical protein